MLRAVLLLLALVPLLAPASVAPLAPAPSAPTPGPDENAPRSAPAAVTPRPSAPAITPRPTRIAPAPSPASVPPLPQADESIVRSWIETVRAHEPGVVDPPLLNVAAAPPAYFRAIGLRLRKVISADCPKPEDRNEILRRAAVLHADLALLLPREAAAFNRRTDGPFYFDVGGREGALVTRPAERLVYSMDGEFKASSVDTAHWWMARQLLRLVTPNPAADAFVGAWYRAVAARFQARYDLGSNAYHLAEGLVLFPRDPYLLLYAGAMHETRASPHVQNMMQTPYADQLQVPPSRDEWREAERLLRRSVEGGGPPEASVRLGRVLARLGRHGEAARVLRAIGPRLVERRLQYFCALFLGSEEAALGATDAARASFERAAELFPTAQSPLLALADLAASTGQRARALEVLPRLQRLPLDPLGREDPWHEYHAGDPAEAERQLAAVRRLAAAGKDRP